MDSVRFRTRFRRRGTFFINMNLERNDRCRCDRVGRRMNHALRRNFVTYNRKSTNSVRRWALCGSDGPRYSDCLEMKAGELGTAKAGVSVDADTGGPQLGKCLGEFAPEVI